MPKTNPLRGRVRQSASTSFCLWPGCLRDGWRPWERFHQFQRSVDRLLQKGNKRFIKKVKFVTDKRESVTKNAFLTRKSICYKKVILLQKKTEFMKKKQTKLSFWNLNDCCWALLGPSLRPFPSARAVASPTLWLNF